MSRLTGDPQVDFRILSELDDLTLIRACQSDAYIRSLCQDENFWRSKTVNRFGPQVLLSKPAHETHQQQYRYLAQMGNIFEESRRGRLDAVMALHNQRQLYPENLRQYLGAGPNATPIPDQVNWSERDKQLIADLAAEGGHYHILDYLKRNKLLPQTVSTGHSNSSEPQVPSRQHYLSEMGRILTETQKREPSRVEFDWVGLHKKVLATLAAERGNLDILEDLDKNGLLPEVLDIQTTNQRVLQWLKQRGKIDNGVWIQTSRVDPEYARDIEEFYERYIKQEYGELVSLCSRAVLLLPICEDPYFWEMKARRDFDVSLEDVPGEKYSDRYKSVKDRLWGKDPNDPPEMIHWSRTGIWSNPNKR